jgi:serine/threonine-protein kinase
MGRLREAEDQLRAALATQRLRLPPGHPDLLTTLNELASVLGARGAEEEAEGLRRQVLEGQLAITGEHHPHATNVIYNLATSLQNQGKLAPARELHEKALALRREIFGIPSLPFAQSLGALAKLHASLGEGKVASRLADEALAMSRALLGPEHPEMAWPLRNSAIVLLAQERAVDAEPLLRQSLALLEKSRPAGHYQTARVRLFLGDCLLRLGRDEEAERQIQQGMASLRDQFGEGDSRVAEARRLLAKLARKRAPAL